MTPAPVPTPGVVAQAAPGTGIVTTPIKPTTPDRLGIRATPELPPSAAVEAHFLDPLLTYHTPGLVNYRRAFTTNPELESWLNDITRQPSAGTTATAFAIGNSQQGNPIWAIAIARGTHTSPAQLQKNGRPTVLLVGQQHGDAPASAEALLVIARELGQGLLEPLLNKVNVVIVPRLNPDGAITESHTLSNGVDLAKDHLSISTPEARSLAQLMVRYDPSVVINAQEFAASNAILRAQELADANDVFLQYATTANTPEFLVKASQEWIYQPMQTAFQAQQLQHQWTYQPTLAADQTLLLAAKNTMPSTGLNVHGLKNMLSLQIESRGQGLGRTHIQRRVHTLVTGLISALRSTTERADRLQQVRDFVAKDTSAMACKDTFVMQSTPTTVIQERLFLDAEKGLDRNIRVAAENPLQLQMVEKRTRPCGYWISSQAAHAANTLRELGLRVLEIGERGTILTENYTQDAAPATNIRVSRTRLLMDAPEGGFYVPLNQPMASLAIAALEPDTSYSYFAQQLIANLNDIARVVSPPNLVFEETP